MKQLILIAPCVTDKKFDYTKAKQKIVSYLGTRLLEEGIKEEVPGLVIKEPLKDEEEMNKLNSLIFSTANDGALVFIKYDENSERSQNNFLVAEMLY